MSDNAPSEQAQKTTKKSKKSESMTQESHEVEQKEPELVEVQIKLPEKIKKPRTEAQKAASQKGLEALKAKRAAKFESEKQQADAEQVKKTQWKAGKKRNPTEELVTKKDLDTFMTSIRGMLAPSPAPTPAPAPARELTPAAAYEAPRQNKNPETAIQPKVSRAATPAAPVKLTGHALLDQLFFS